MTTVAAVLACLMGTGVTVWCAKGALETELDIRRRRRRWFIETMERYLDDEADAKRRGIPPPNLPEKYW